MMTGVLHFTAISFNRVVVNQNLRPAQRAVNSRSRRSLLLLAMLGLSLAASASAQTAKPSFSVLVFSKTTGFRHDSIPDGIAAIRALGVEHGFGVAETEDAGRFTDAILPQYKVVVFLSTTGDVLDSAQKAAFEGYIRSGGGFVGIHSASDT